MVIVVPVSRSDELLIPEFVKLFNLFGPYTNHELLVVCRPSDYKWGRSVFKAISEDNDFSETDFFVFDEDGPFAWPTGPNHYWYETVKYLDEERKNKLPWLWLEIDMLPIRDYWVDLLEEEYYKSKKLFMGCLAKTTTVTADQTVLELCDHLVGAAIYPPRLNKYSKLWKHVTKVGTAWDVLCQWEFVPLAHDTKLIQHVFRTYNYKKVKTRNGTIIVGDDYGGFQEEYQHNYPVDFENAVLVHGCKDVTLGELIYEKECIARGLPIPESTTTQPVSAE